MHISIFDLFKIGIGPSSSHTVGPMRAAVQYLERLQENYKLEDIARIKVELYGSLALTGLGHGTDKAVLLGLCGYAPDTVDIDEAEKVCEAVKSGEQLNILLRHKIDFNYRKDLDLISKKLPEHPNGMNFISYNAAGEEFFAKKYFSVGGGFFLSAKEISENHNNKAKEVKYQFTKATRLLEICRETGLTIAEIVEANEAYFYKPEEIEQNLSAIWKVMQECVDKGCITGGILPGGLDVARRAPNIYKKLQAEEESPEQIFDWVSLYALAVNEENAAGGRVVTAPTNGAAGIIPAVLHYYMKYQAKGELSMHELKKFFFTAGAIGFLYKENASISGAEMGCQGEVGVACSMAAGGLAALKKSTPEQVEVAAEIGMEHNLGLTCDPIKGLVQIPCIERNTMGAIKAINAARLAANNEGTQKVSLDKVIRTMRQIGRDMKSRYKETSKGGLAINIIEC